jgi:tetratricopeptide (TPR) repeat protein
MEKPQPQYLKLEEERPNDWAFNRPSEWEFFDRRLDRAENAEREGDIVEAMKICREIVESCPEYLPAVNKLGLLFKEQDDLDAAIEIFEGAVGVGVACLPEGFEFGKDRIPWYWEDNRAFLLACEHLAMTHLEKALNLFEYSLDINPGYHGIAELVSKLRCMCGFEDPQAHDEN